MKCVMRSQAADIDDNTKSSFYLSVISKKPALMDSSDENEHQKTDPMERSRCLLPKDRVYKWHMIVLTFIEICIYFFTKSTLVSE